MLERDDLQDLDHLIACRFEEDFAAPLAAGLDQLQEKIEVVKTDCEK